MCDDVYVDPKALGADDEIDEPPNVLEGKDTPYALILCLAHRYLGGEAVLIKRDGYRLWSAEERLLLRFKLKTTNQGKSGGGARKKTKSCGGSQVQQNR